MSAVPPAATITPSGPPPQYYSAVDLNNDDPPPPYPGEEEPPPPYFTVAAISEEVIDDICYADPDLDQLTNGPVRKRKRPLAPRIVAWCDVLTNLPLVLIFYIDFVVKYRVSFYSMWISATLNLAWIHGAYQLHQSSDLRKRKWERKELTETWRKFNIFFLIVFGCLAVFITYVVATERWFPNASTPWRAILIVMYFIPFLVRVTFFVVIANYIKKI